MRQPRVEQEKFKVVDMTTGRSTILKTEEAEVSAKHDGKKRKREKQEKQEKDKKKKKHKHKKDINKRERKREKQKKNDKQQKETIVNIASRVEAYNPLLQLFTSRLDDNSIRNLKWWMGWAQLDS